MEGDKDNRGSIELVSGVSVHASASSWKVVTSRFISWRDISKIKECERSWLALRSCWLCQHGFKIIDNYHISLSGHVFANWMRWHMRGVDLRNMPQPRESIVLIEI